MQDQSGRPRVRRDTAWKRDGRARGIYWRRRANGTKSWGYFADGKIHSAPSRQAAIDSKAQAGLRRSAGLPAPDTRVKIADLAEEVREAKRRKLRPASLQAFEYALDSILLPEVGHLKPGACGPDRVAKLIRDLENRGLAPASIKRYLTPLSAIFQLAVRRGIVPSSPLSLLSDDERPNGGGKRAQFRWSRQAIRDLVSAAEYLARQPEARYDYTRLIRFQIGTGLRPSECLGLRVRDVGLLEGRLFVSGSLLRDGTVGDTKTAAGRRIVPLSDELVELLVAIIPENALPEHFIFHAHGNPSRALSYFNYRRAFKRVLHQAGLQGENITPHKLRRASVSALQWGGVSLVETSKIVGHGDPSITAKAYSDIFEPDDAFQRVREAQARVFSTEEGGETNGE
jgi:integrase